ncbi:TPA: hypothetical protein VB681_000217 [Streptococcus pyogenes]|nr:hypothetical protein [Streptococcus pyogenes]
MEKLTLKKEKENTATLPFFVGIDLHAQIKEISTETGIPMRRIIERMITANEKPRYKDRDIDLLMNVRKYRYFDFY